MMTFKNSQTYRILRHIEDNGILSVTQIWFHVSRVKLHPEQSTEHGTYLFHFKVPTNASLGGSLSLL